MEIKFMYHYDREHRPIVTICELRMRDDRQSRGIALCSRKDTPCKKTGRKIALDRATYAMKVIMGLKPWKLKTSIGGCDFESHLIEREEAIDILKSANCAYLTCKILGIENGPGK